MKKFIYLQTKRITRSSFWKKNLVITLITGFFLFLVLLELLGVGIFLEKLLSKNSMGMSPEQLLNKILIYYFMVVFMLRFFIQDLPVMEITPLLTLPVRRRQISLFLNYRSLLSFFNFLPFFLFLPFAVSYLPEHYPASVAFSWFAALLLFELASNFLVIRVKRQTTVKPVTILVVFAVAVFVGLSEKFHLFSFSVISSWYFDHLLQQPLWIGIPLLVLLVFFGESYRYIQRHSYLEELGRKKKRTEHLSSHFEGLEKRGKIGALILKEVRLLLRNKRSKQMVLFTLPVGLLYGLIFYPDKENLSHDMLLAFVGIFVTGVFLISYGQYILAWESAHFDFILTSNVNMEAFFRAKYYLMVIPTVVLWILQIPYVFFGTKILIVNTVMMLYNLGVNGLMLLFLASYNRKRMDLDRGQMLNYQGVGLNNYINIIPIFLVPSLLFWILSWLFGLFAALEIISLLGILGMLFHRTLIRAATRFFMKKRYEIAQGYRSS